LIALGEYRFPVGRLSHPGSNWTNLRSALARNSNSRCAQSKSDEHSSAVENVSLSKGRSERAGKLGNQGGVGCRRVFNRVLAEHGRARYSFMMIPRLLRPRPITPRKHE